MQCRLTLLSTRHKHYPLRTKRTEGSCYRKPTVGNGFILYAKPLDPAADMRRIHTRAVQTVKSRKKGKVLEFETRNSTYKWESLNKRP